MPPGDDDPRHLAECPRAVGEEHQGHLAEHGVERPIGEWQSHRVALPPLDVGSNAAGDGEHRLVEIETDDRAWRTDEVGGGTGDDARTTGDVEHVVTLGHSGDLAQDRRPLGEEAGNERRLVAFGGLDRDLERLGGTGSRCHTAMVRTARPFEHRSNDPLIVRIQVMACRRRPWNQRRRLLPQRGCAG